MSTAILYDPNFGKGHRVPGIPEGPDRAECIINKLQEDGILDLAKLIVPRQCNLNTLKANHDGSYLEDFRTACLANRGHVEHVADTSSEVWYDRVAAKNIVSSGLAEVTFTPGELAKLRRKIISDEQENTPIAEDSYELSLSAAGAVIDACDLVMKGTFSNAFCVVRPPGHHAEYDAARGFCFVNNIAVGARHLLNVYGLTRVMIVDFDVHHGNGAQHSFYDESRVLVCNIHRNPQRFYPYNCGFEDEIGTGDGLGFNLNIPLAAGSGGQAYNDALANIAARAIEFQPQFILVSAGFDAHRNDSMGGMNLSSEYFGFMTEKLKVIAKLAGGKMVSVLEGGYDRPSLAESAAMHVRSLLKF